MEKDTKVRGVLPHLPLLRELLNLKKLRRTGWQLRGIKDGESLADHSFGVSLLTLILAGQVATPLNRERALLLAMVHELGEVRVGDIPFPALPYFPEKSAMEQRAVADLLCCLGSSGETLIEAFSEFEAGATVEARFVRAIDKFEMLLTAAEYERAGVASLLDFWRNDATFRTFEEFPELAELAIYLRETRQQRLQGGQCEQDET